MEYNKEKVTCDKSLGMGTGIDILIRGKRRECYGKRKDKHKETGVL